MTGQDGNEQKESVSEVDAIEELEGKLAITGRLFIRLEICTMEQFYSVSGNKYFRDGSI
jgi:hypothetical protein